VDLPRTSASQYLVGEPVERDALQSGDLVFFRNTYRAGISHVGIYVGNGRFVHAASTSKDVRIDRLDSPYYAKRFAGGRRVGTLVSAMKH
ncbi:MAG: C40 family peptidase, partial [Thermoanaerobaculia bacterium]